MDELELPYQLTQTGGKHGGNDHPDFLAMNPTGKVPVLVDDNQSVWESSTILRYLTNQYGENQWQIEQAGERSLYERWMDWSQSTFEPAFIGVFWGHYRTPPRRRNNEAILDSVKKCESCLGLLSEQLSAKEFLLGPYLSLADISVGVFLHRLYQIDLTIDFPNNIQDWYSRLATRPAYRKWAMSDFTELEGRLDY